MDEATLTVWLDTALLMLGGFILMAILMLSLINPPKQEDSESGIKSPGNLIIEVIWEQGVDADVDLWVQAPNERPVGYSNKNSATLNLLRDDLGSAKDTTPINYEVTFSRGIPPGEYVINVHMYRGVSVKYPLKIDIVIRIMHIGNSNPSSTIATVVYLKREDDQVTVTRFIIGDDGTIIPSSINNLYKDLRTASK